MKHLIFIAVLCCICFLLLGSQFIPSAYSTSGNGLKWWINVYAKNNEYLEVTVRTEDDGRRYQNVWFDATYFNQKGVRIGIMNAAFTEQEGPQSVLQPGKTYRKYYKLNAPAASVKGGIMRFTVIQPSIPLYRVPQ